MVKQKTGQLALCLTALALALAAAGCGGEPAAAGQAVGNGANPGTSFDAPASQPRGEQYIADAWIKDKEGFTSLGLEIANNGSESVTIQYDEFLFDGEAVEAWQPSEPAFTLEPMTGKGRGDLALIGMPAAEFVSQYAEWTVKATVTAADGTGLEPVVATFRTSELLGTQESAPAPGPKAGDVVLAAQELYSANGLIVTLPEQTLRGLTTDVEGLHYEDPLIRFENQTGDDLFIRFEDACVNGTAAGIGDAFGEDYYDAAPAGGESCEQTLALGGALTEAVVSGAASGEITFTLYLSADMETALDEAELTIPFMVAAG